MALKTINDLTALTTPASTDLVGVWAVGAARMRKSTIAQLVAASNAALMAGRAGGQAIYGGTAANEDLVLEGTSHATKTTSTIILQPTGGKVGVLTATPVSAFQVDGTINAGLATAGYSLGTTAILPNGAGGWYHTTNDTTGTTIFYSNLGGLQFSVENVPSALVISKTTGYAGFGIVAPASKLDIGAGAFQLSEMTAPAAGAANTARMFCRDNGGGKSQLCIIFATGAIQVLATEP